MSMAGRRSWRRARPHQTLLPQTSHSSHSPNTVSCWYCDFKICAFNGTLYSFGRRYARFLNVWFTIGAAFCFVAFVGVSMMLLLDFFGAFDLYGGPGLADLSMSYLFGPSSILPGLSISIVNAGILISCTILSVGLHEFGHAVAATSKGVQIEYIAIFIACLFPGALIALNNNWLQSLPRFTGFRIYCAGIWHNIVFCAACLITLFSLPIILRPAYVHGDGPLVLGVQNASLLSGYLSTGDVIMAVDGSRIRTPHEWRSKMTGINLQSFREPELNDEKGYCIPISWIEASSKIEYESDEFACADEFTAFQSMSTNNSSMTIDSKFLGDNSKILEGKYCLIAKDVVKLNKCGSGWSIGSNVSCSELESCMMPVKISGISWVEVTYSSPYSLECLEHSRNLSASSESLNLQASPCGGTFVFVGDTPSVMHSLELSAYRPKSASTIFMSYVPHVLEKVVSYNFHVSASIALLNCLPVFFLDGESILESIICFMPWLGLRKRQKVLKFCLLAGTFLSIISFARTLLNTLAVGK